MKKLALTAMLAFLPFASLNEFAATHTASPGLASCGPQKPILVSRTATLDLPSGFYYRLLLDPDFKLFNLALLNAQGEMVYTWLGFVEGDEAKTFSLAFEGDRAETLKTFKTPCEWLYPSQQ